MYTIICFFRVKEENLDLFLKTAKKTGNLLMSHGAIDHKLYCSSELTGQQGSMGLLNLFELDEGEELIMGQSVFNSEEHYYEVMKDTGNDDIIQYLSSYMEDLVEMEKTISSKFHSA
ncbi:DUF1428 family protein [Halobacillus sp. Marseille-Q1614]|uniref:DUF1428 family protein n=1 Tax=Halobacillus sp. Marseille-Q1614 TaxID=2709134 RepID=UPI00156DAA6B|nr:DUF1428 family protein [Halobacillus sp. Marseille-Q1614]